MQENTNTITTVNESNALDRLNDAQRADLSRRGLKLKAELKQLMDDAGIDDTIDLTTPPAQQLSIDEMHAKLNHIGTFNLSCIYETYQCIGTFQDMADTYRGQRKRADHLRTSMTAARWDEELTGLETFRKALEGVYYAASEFMGFAASPALEITNPDWATRVGVIANDTNQMFSEGMAAASIAEALHAIGPVIGFSDKARLRDVK